MCETEILKRKNTALRRKEKKRKTFYCNKMNNKKIMNWDFYEIRVGKFFWRNLHHRLKKYFKEQSCTFLERNEYRQSLQYQSKKQPPEVF